MRRASGPQGRQGIGAPIEGRAQGKRPEGCQGAEWPASENADLMAKRTRKQRRRRRRVGKVLDKATRVAVDVLPGGAVAHWLLGRKIRRVRKRMFGL